MKTFPPLAALAAGAVLFTACAGAQADPRDPLEPANRAVDAFNRNLDRGVLHPVAAAYQRTVPQPIRTGITNFFGNLGDAWSAANSLLQAKPGDAVEDGMRFAMNTVFGGIGVLDLASRAGMERHKEDFGTTLAHWGVPSGPYLVLPLLGPSTLRDTAALPVDWIGSPLSHVAPVVDRAALVAGQAVDTRARLLPLDAALASALDPYTFMRDGYLQHRSAQVDDGVAAAPSPVDAE